MVLVLNRSAAGLWTLTYAGPAQTYWQIWARSSGGTDWSNVGEMRNSAFPAPDSDMVPDGASWWQIKVCGDGDDDCQTTPFSNIISFGPVPA